MIADPETLSTLRSEWAGVLLMVNRMRSLATATFAGGSFAKPANVIYNIPLLLAFDVLKQTLQAMRDEGRFQCKSKNPSLGTLLRDARKSVPWIDWGALKDGKCRRNAVAHDGVLHDSVQCLGDIERVAAQLKSWGMVESAVV
jgi:hypothetical protein